MPSWPLWPSAEMATLKFDCGSLPVPRLWKGPLMLKLIGVVKVLEPVGVSVKLTPSTPLLTGLPLAKVCLSRVCASPEEPDPPELEPQAASPSAATTTPRSSPRRNHGRRDVFLVCMQHPPQLWQGPGRECSIAPVRRSLIVLLVVLFFPAAASAPPVLVLGHDGRATRHNDRFVTGPALTPAPASVAAPALSRTEHGALATRATGKRKPKKPEITFLSELTRLHRIGQLSTPSYRADTGAYNHALATERKLRGTRRTELTAITVTLHD